MIDKIKEYIGEAQAFSTQNAAELESFRIKFLGSKGLLKVLFAEFKNVPNDQKKEFGMLVNEVRSFVTESLDEIKEKLEKAANFKDIFVLDTAGVSSRYANDGGVIIAC